MDVRQRSEDAPRLNQDERIRGGGSRLAPPSHSSGLERMHSRGHLWLVEIPDVVMKAPCPADI